MKTKIKDLLQAALAELEQEDKPAWTLTRHLPGFRALRDGEEWHRQDWTEDMLAGGWRPVLAKEQQEPGDEFIGQSAYKKGAVWHTVIGNFCLPAEIFPPLFQRTRRPLPEPAKVVPWGGPEDFPVNCWLRHKHSPELHYWPVLVAPLGVRVFCPQEHILSWQLLADCYQHSFDCKTWLPCTKEVLP